MAYRRSTWFTLMSWGLGRDWMGFVVSYSSWTGGCGSPFACGVIFRISARLCPFVLPFCISISKRFLFISSNLSVSRVLFNSGGASEFMDTIRINCS
jgi:hypothetical protein